MYVLLFVALNRISRKYYARWLGLKIFRARIPRTRPRWSVYQNPSLKSCIRPRDTHFICPHVFACFAERFHRLSNWTFAILCLQCSKSCGRGYQYRPVECATTLNRALSSNTECDRRSKPPVWRQCNLGECGSFLFWRVGPWSQVKWWYDIFD